MKKILLDTNAYVKYLSGDKNILDMIVKADMIYLSIFVLGELYAGFRGGSQYEKNNLILDQFLKKSTVQILQGSEETAEIFGQIKYNLKKAGTPVPINDIWIAAHAVETGSVIITYDTHFLKIPGLRLWDNI